MHVQTYGADSEQYRLTYGGFFMEPHVAERILLEMLRAEKNVRLLTRRELLKVVKDDARVTASTYKDRDTGEIVRIAHRVAVDGTYEGDFAAAAGCRYRVGREGRREFGEKLAGEIFHDWRPHRGGEVLPQSTGEPSPHVQANCFRLTLCDDPARRIPILKPDSYADFLPYYRDLGDDFATGRVRFLREILWLNPLANRKLCLNGHIEALTSIDLAEHSSEWIEGDWSTRERLYRVYKDYTLGLLWFLQNDGEIPRVAREDARAFGLPPDEYPTTGHFPWQLYVRQGRRIVGEYSITEHDSSPPAGRERPHIHKDAIAIYEHGFDSHQCRTRGRPGATVTTSDGFELIEGVIWFRNGNKLKAPNRPATVPYRAIVPEKVDGLLVPSALSATNVAFSAIRMEPAFMALGQAAGAAAAQALAERIDVRRIDVRRLQETLAGQGQVLAYFKNLSLDDPDFAQVQLRAVAEDCPTFELPQS